MSNLTEEQQTNARVALREGTKITDVLGKLDQGVNKVISGKTYPSLPKGLQITDEISQAISDLPKVFGQITMTEPRLLTDEEKTKIFDEYKTLGKVSDLLVERREAVKEYIRTHVDKEAEAQGIANDNARDFKGHYMVSSKGNPFRVPVPGTNQDFSLEYRGGNPGWVEVSSEKLLDMYESGEITRDQYLAVTKEVRVFDEAKATEAILKDSSLLDVVGKASLRKGNSAASQSLFVRKTKG